jgi:transposase
MELSEAQYERVKDALPVQRGNVSLSNLQVLNALLYVAEQGCKWRGLPKRFGRWHTVYMRMSRWSKNGVLARVFEKLQVEQIVRIKLEAVSLDSTSIKVHPDGTEALKKADHCPSASPKADGTSRFIWLPRLHERPSLTPSRNIASELLTQDIREDHPMNTSVAPAQMACGRSVHSGLGIDCSGSSPSCAELAVDE